MRRKALLCAFVSAFFLMTLGPRGAALPDYNATFTKLYSLKPDTPLAKALRQFCHVEPAGGQAQPLRRGLRQAEDSRRIAFPTVETSG
jgi:hypothetical protein